MRELTIGKNDAGQRLDKFITKTLDLPMSLLYKSIRLKKIRVNRKRAENKHLQRLGTQRLHKAGKVYLYFLLRW